MGVRRYLRNHRIIDATRDVSLGESAGRMALLAGIGVVLGIVGGFAAWLIVRLVGLLSNLALLHQVAFDLPDLQHYQPGPSLLLVAVAGGLIVALLARWAPTIRGHGIPESIEAIIFEESRIPPRVVVAKPISAAIAMGTGGPFGAEGPIIVTGGSAGSLIGQVLRLSAAERRIVLATGAAAGMAGVFATPIASIVIAFELLLFERSLRALLPLLLATGVATEIHYQIIGSKPLFEAVGLHTVAGSQIPLYVVLGVASGLMAVVLNRGLFGVEALFRRSRIPEFFHPIVGAVGYAVVGFIVPGSLSVGYWAIDGAVNGKFVAGFAAVLLVGKLISWWIALASNTSGGTLAPIFIVSSMMGLLIGIGFDQVFPGIGIQPAAFAVVAMGATFGVAARALLTGAVFAVEATGSFELIVPMVIATGIAELVGHRLLDERLMTDKLLRRGVRVEFDTQVDPLRTATAGASATPLPPGPLDPHLPKVDAMAFLDEAAGVLLEESVDTVVVCEDGEPVGVLGADVIANALRRRRDERQIQMPSLLRRGGSAPARDSGPTEDLADAAIGVESEPPAHDAGEVNGRIGTNYLPDAQSEDVP